MNNDQEKQRKNNGWGNLIAVLIATIAIISNWTNILEFLQKHNINFDIAFLILGQFCVLLIAGKLFSEYRKQKEANAILKDKNDELNFKLEILLKHIPIERRQRVECLMRIVLKSKNNPYGLCHLMFDLLWEENGYGTI